jgi:hypothetical protein
MKDALQSAFIVVLWVAFWLAGTLGGALGLSTSGFCPLPIRRGSLRSFIGFFAGAYAAVKLGDLAVKQK